MTIYKHLPHINAYDNYQFITYRLSDSLPHNTISNLTDELSDLEESKRNLELQKKIEQLVNTGFGSSILIHPLVAEIVISNWLYFSGKMYDLISWVIMPNHVHLLIKEYLNNDISSIVKKWKSYTSKEIIKISDHLKQDTDKYRYKKIELDNLIRSNKIWQKSYWDHYIRNDEELYNTILYIDQNPVSAGLVISIEDWRYSSVNWK